MPEQVTILPLQCIQYSVHIPQVINEMIAGRHVAVFGISMTGKIQRKYFQLVEQRRQRDEGCGVV